MVIRKNKDGMLQIITPKKAKEPVDGVVHKLFIVNAKYPPSPIQEAECRIVVTEKVSWAEPIMPLRGALRNQKRFMLGAMAFYLRSQAEKKKVLLLIQAMKAGPRQRTMSYEAQVQLEKFKATGELR